MKRIIQIILYSLLPGIQTTSAHIDSIAGQHLPAIIAAKSDTAKIMAVLDYATALYPYDKDSAYAIALSSYSQSKSIKFRNGIGQALFKLAEWEYGAGRLFASDSFFNLMLIEIPAPSHWHIPAYAGVGTCSFLQGFPEEAAEYYYAAIRLLYQYENIKLYRAYIYNNMAGIWRHLGNSDNSLLYLRLGKEWAEKEKDMKQLGNSWNRIGNYYLAKNDSARALHCYHEAHRISSTFGDTEMILITTCNINLIQNKEPELKKEAYRYVLEQAKDHNRLGILAPVANSLYLLGEKRWAEQIWNESITLATKLNMRVFLTDSYNGLSNLHAEAGNFRMAYFFLDKYISLRDSVSNQEALKTMAIMEKRAQKVKQEHILAAQELSRIEITNAISEKNRIVYLLGAGGASGMLLLFFFRKNIRRKKELLEKTILLKEKESVLRKMYAAIEGKENERKRIAQELHDGVGSLLSVAKMNASILAGKEQDLLHSVPFQEAIRILDNTARNVRTISHNLMPDILLKGGIEEALQLFCKYTSKANNISIDFQSYGNSIELNPKLEKNIFIMLQDIVMQLLHQSTHIEKMDIQLNWSSPSLFVTIETNGLFSPDNNNDASEWHILQNRISETGGNMEVQHDENAGSTIDLEFDLNNDKIIRV